MEVEHEDSSGDEDWERIPTSSAPGVIGAQPAVGAKVGEWFVERAKYIPLRLTLPERKFLRLLEAALSVSEYTDKIDTINFDRSGGRVEHPEKCE